MSQDRHRTIWTNMTLVFCFMIMFLCMRRKDMAPYILTILRKIFFARLISRYFPLYFFMTYICQLSSRLHKKFIFYNSNDTSKYNFQDAEIFVFYSTRMLKRPPATFLLAKSKNFLFLNGFF